MVSYVFVRCGMVWNGVWYDVVWCVVGCGIVWYGVVLCGKERCGAV